MAKKIAINGFGRIGRLVFRYLFEDESVEVVAINDLTDNNTLAHLLKYDSAQGNFGHDVKSDEGSIIVNGKKINAYSIRDPKELPWKELGVDVVLECTGIFRSKETAGAHVHAGAQKVIISAPAKGDDVPTVVLGVNKSAIGSENAVYSNASCTTNCMAPVVDIVEMNWGIVQGSMTTIHAYTADQNLQDAPHSDLRRARAAALNIVPTTTGAATAVSKVLPSTKGKITAMAVRVPVIVGSLIELNVLLEKETTVEEINQKFKEAAEGPLKGILQYSEDELVSTDIIGNRHSSIFDSKLTKVDGRFAKLVSWYDNEAGYSARLAELASMI